MSKRRNPNRGVVLSLSDAWAIHRWLAYVLDDRKFYNPIEAYEAKQAAESAHLQLGAKLITIAEAHQAQSNAEAIPDHD